MDFKREEGQRCSPVTGTLAKIQSSYNQQARHAVPSFLHLKMAPLLRGCKGPYSSLGKKMFVFKCFFLKNLLESVEPYTPEMNVDALKKQLLPLSALVWKLLKAKRWMADL